MRRVLWTAVVGLTFVCAHAQGADGKRPNILWLIAEDFGQHLGCYGTKEVFTPTLDRLASQGVRYTRFFTTAPVCSPSRSAFMTGMYQTTIGAHQHRSHRDDGFLLPSGVKLATDWFRGAGYFTANIRTFPKNIGPGAGVLNVGAGKTDWNFTYLGQPFDSSNWEDLQKHQPFFAQVNFSETHRPFKAPKHADPARVELPPYYPDHPITRNDWAAYLDSATALDGKIAGILDRLKADGLAQSTIIVFFGDNGQAHVRGKQWCYESGLKVPLIIYIPAAIPAPKHYQAGSVDKRLLAAIDLLPTMLSLAGVARPQGMQGQVFLGQHADPDRQLVFGARDRCDETPARIRTVRDDRYRYIRNFHPSQPFLLPNGYKEHAYPVWNLIKQLHNEGSLNPIQDCLAAPHMPKEELYDLQDDPHEIKNLINATDPHIQARLQKLRKDLENWIIESKDQGAINEPKDVARRMGSTKPGSNPNAPAIIPKQK